MGYPSRFSEIGHLVTKNWSWKSWMFVKLRQSVEWQKRSCKPQWGLQITRCVNSAPRNRRFKLLCHSLGRKSKKPSTSFSLFFFSSISSLLPPLQPCLLNTSLKMNWTASKSLSGRLLVVSTPLTKRKKNSAIKWGMVKRTASSWIWNVRLVGQSIHCMNWHYDLLDTEMFSEMQKLGFFCALPMDPTQIHMECRRV